MRFRFSLLAVVLLAATAARAGELDTAKLDEARSLIAEAAALAHNEAAGKITGVYADGLREDIRKSLKKLLAEPALRSDVQGALTALDCHDGASLAAIRDRLVARERAHGRAS